jgi:hypothetical protein
MSTDTTTTNTTTVSEKTLQLVRDVIADFKNGPAKKEVERFVTFLNAAIDSPECVHDAYLTYYAGSPEKGLEIIKKLGTNATFGDLAEAVKKGIIQQ